MRPKKPETTGEGDLFRARLEQIIHLKHELMQERGPAAATIDKPIWDRTEFRCGRFLTPKACERLMVPVQRGGNFMGRTAN